MRVKTNIALFSSHQHVYSQTFVQAQKDLLPFRVYYYYNGLIPRILEGGERFKHSWYKKIAGALSKNKRSPVESFLITSLRRHNIKAIVAQFGPTGAACVNVSLHTGIPLIVHFHGADAYVQDFISPVEPYQKLFAAAKAMIVVSDDMQQQLLKLGAPKDKIFKTAYGPRDGFFSIQPDYNSTRFFAIGRFVDKKAPYFTLLAFSKVAEQFKNATLVMAGDGPLLDACRNMAKYLAVEKQVQFLGVIKHEKVFDYMQQSFCFVQHSVTAGNGDKEGSPVAIVEAAAAGLPVIATLHAGIPFSVKNGVTGYLVEEGDVQNMAAQMIKLYSDRDLAKQLGTAAREHIRENISMEKYIGDIANIINDALAVKDKG